MSIRILIGDTRARLRDLPDESVHCCVTSPPYFGLRAYLPDGHADKHMEIGLEDTPAAFVAVMVEVFREVRRVMRPDATLWLNLGDSYASTPTGTLGGKITLGGGHDNQAAAMGRPDKSKLNGLKPKDLIGVPWRVAFALQADGWYLRQDIVWSKGNPMPESVTDRCCKSHEYMFLLTKSARYHFDSAAIAEPVAPSSVERLSQRTLDQQAGSDRVPGKTNGPMKAVGGMATRTKRSVWHVATAPFSGAHFAVFPPALIEPCILAGCPKDCCAKCGAPVVRVLGEATGGSIGYSWHDHSRDMEAGNAKSVSSKGYVPAKTTGWSPSCSCDAGTARGVCLDPFGGAGTTGLVADRLGRDAILIELNPEYATLAQNRINADAGMFAKVANG